MIVISVCVCLHWLAAEWTVGTELSLLMLFCKMHFAIESVEQIKSKMYNSIELFDQFIYHDLHTFKNDTDMLIQNKIQDHNNLNRWINWMAFNWFSVDIRMEFVRTSDRKSMGSFFLQKKAINKRFVSHFNFI